MARPHRSPPLIRFFKWIGLLGAIAGGFYLHNVTHPPERVYSYNRTTDPTLMKKPPPDELEETLKMYKEEETKMIK